MRFLNNKGFTLIEALAVITVLTLLTSFLILYNRSGELQIKILRDKAQLINAIFKAKNFALGSLAERDVGSQIICGYGVRFFENRYFIYRDLASDCAISDNIYSGPESGELIEGETRELDASLVIKLDDFYDVLFQPPLPKVFFNGSAASGERIVVIGDSSGAVVSEIIINSAGQISD